MAMTMTMTMTTTTMMMMMIIRVVMMVGACRRVVAQEGIEGSLRSHRPW